MALPEVYTMADALDALDAFSRGRASASQDILRRCIRGAYHEVSTAHDWSFSQVQGRVNVYAPQTTGTVTYDHCVTPDHEALTRNGWKRYDELGVGEEILAYDHTSETTRWEPIEALHVYDFNGSVFELVRRGRVIFRCTPNHRIPVWKRQGRERRYKKQWIYAKDATHQDNVVLCAPHEVETAGELDARQAALLGWCVTDGTGLFNRKYHKAEVLQSQKANPENCVALAALVGRQAEIGPRRNGVAEMLRFSLLPKDRNFLRAQVADRSDVIRTICKMGVHEAEAVYRAMYAAEGTKGPHGAQVFSQYGYNGPIAESFQIACVLTGRAANLNVHRWSSSGINHTRYSLPIKTRTRLNLKKQSRWVPYCGVVWCPQVSTGAWVMRCNGAVMMTGNSGGVYERQLTLAGATWPSAWIEDAAIRIDDVVCDVEEYKSATVVTLDAVYNPGADVAAGSSYSAYPRWYSLPNDFGQMISPLEKSSWGVLTPVPFGEMAALDQYRDSDGDMGWYSIGPAPDRYGQLAIYVHPPSDTDEVLSFVYRKKARELRYSGYNSAEYAGTVAVTAALATVTGTSTTFESGMIGSIFRISSTAARPTGLEGTNAWVEQRVVAAVTDTTHLTLDANIATTRTGRGYVISDPIDLEGAAWEAFLRCCEKHYALHRGVKDLAAIVTMYEDALFRAKGADCRVIQPIQANVGRTHRGRLADSTDRPILT